MVIGGKQFVGSRGVERYVWGKVSCAYYRHAVIAVTVNEMQSFLYGCAGVKWRRGSVILMASSNFCLCHICRYHISVSTN